MSTTPQMSQQQYGQPQYGQQQGFPQQQGGFPQGQQGFPQGQSGQQQGPNTSPPQIQQQLQQLGQQQPFQQLLQQMGQHMGGMQQTEQPLVLPSAIEAASVTSGIATKFWDVVTPLPGQPSILYLFIANNWHPLANPSQTTHDAVRQAFAFGQQVIGFFDTKTGAIQAVVVNRQ
ncbi:hypothetical protein [Streptomyces melanogenes]|uniref:hypothetical protein n=1 Tax=Streptomyces melanogenes TaxID=67326 RepID=UPI00167C4D52|nr:hypothetical protein [Streptomyces melanogenes]GGP49482.1 hypothetical protein GCM10010278_28030 [Streptomyces melanogenes]